MYVCCTVAAFVLLLRSVVRYWYRYFYTRHNSRRTRVYLFTCPTRVCWEKEKNIIGVCRTTWPAVRGYPRGTGSLHFVRLLESSSSSKYRRFPRARRASFVSEVAKAFCGSNNEIGHTHGRRGGIFAAIKRIFKIEHGPQTFGTTSVRFSFDRFTGVRKGRARHA